MVDVFVGTFFPGIFSKIRKHQNRLGCFVHPHVRRISPDREVCNNTYLLYKDIPLEDSLDL